MLDLLAGGLVALLHLEALRLTLRRPGLAPARVTLAAAALALAPHPPLALAGFLAARHLVLRWRR